MAESMVLKVEPRLAKGGREAGRLRKKGYVPAIIYGHKENAEAVSVLLEDLQSVLRHHGQTVTLEEAGNKKETVLIQEVQHDHLGKDILHVDFRRVSADELITRIVPVELRGIAPGASAGVLDQPLHTVHVRCTPANLPESIRVSIDKLQLGQAIHVSELVLPQGVAIVESPEAIVVQVKTRTAEPVVASLLPVEGAAEPEVITAKKKAEETEE